MKNKIKHIIITILIFWVVEGVAQDAQFTQFYASPLFLNPAYTGETFEHRFAGNFRNQWPGISKAYKTYAISYDYNMTDIRSGIGFQVLSDKAGSLGLTTNSLFLSYAYYYPIEKRKFKYVRMGLQFGYISKFYDQSNLIFNDQLYTGSSMTNDLGVFSKTNYININAGALYTSPISWFGIAFRNLNKPNTSLVDGDSRLPVKFSIHGGHKFIIEKKGNFLKKYFAPAINYRQQADFDQLDIGAYYFTAPMNFGVWYHGIPMKHYKPGYPNADAICFLVGVDLMGSDMRIGLSYDLTLSRLATLSSGATEISVVYEIAKKSKRRKVYVSCPKF